MKRTKNNIRNKNRRIIFILLAKLILCLAVISTAVVIAFSKEVKSYLDVSVSQENNQNGTSEKSSEIDTNQFDGIPVINDNRKVPVICYHSVNKDPKVKSPIIMSEEKFRQQIQTIKDDGYTTLTMDQLNDYLFKDKSIPEKSVVITFDDGYKNTYSNTFPILKEFHMFCIFLL